ncbi:MAG: sulfatase-like hydrolase/transferase [Anaerolineales bacterium]|jgi:hypothetical protein
MSKFYLIFRRKFIFFYRLIRAGNWSEIGQKIHQNIKSLLLPILGFYQLVHDLTINLYWRWIPRSRKSYPDFQFSSLGLISNSTDKRKNVVWIMLDALRQDIFDQHLMREGLTNLSREGIYFPKAFAQGSWTYPSVFSFLTGRYPFNCGVTKLGRDNGKLVSLCTDFDDNCPTIFSILREEGYSIASILDGWGYTVRKTAGQGHREDRYFVDNWGWLYGLDRRFMSIREQRDATQAFIKDTDHNQPFMLFVRSLYTHSPYRGIFPSPEYVNEMSRKGWSFRIVEGFIRGLRTFEEAYIDPLTTTLAEIGTLDNTIIILCSDHGDMFWNLEEDLRNGLVDEEMWRHQLEPYNALTKVPLLIWGSQLQGVYPHRFRLMDVVPTLLEELNINYDPLAFDGKSVRSSDPRPLYADSAGYGFGGIALQKEGHKFLMSHRLGSTSYDISEDEYELLAKRRESTTGVEVLTEFVLGAARTDDVIVENGEDDALKRRLEALGYL